MSKSVKVLRNSLIALALGAALPVWAADGAASQSPGSAQVASPQPHQRALDLKARTLDLKAPDIRDVMPADAWNSVLPDPDEAVVETETVQVHGATPTPYVPGGFAALYWAATHPGDAWRILAPIM
ncbi:MAG TPA: hypothetical protein VHB68_05555 [Steroidobacteraceae bacterium]|nr:hypothetical protein [Steroidobacteraceae bacterium]